LVYLKFYEIILNGTANIAKNFNLHFGGRYKKVSVTLDAMKIYLPHSQTLFKIHRFQGKFENSGG